MWIPAWLGEVYSKLFSEYRSEVFTFQEARKFLGFDDNKLAVAFSKLHKNRILLVFDAGKPRLYRLLTPDNFILLASENVQNLEKVTQERYVKLLCDAFRLVFALFDLSSFAVYGSVARGTASNLSDVDVLIVSNDFSGSLGSRITRLYSVETTLHDELDWLKKHGVHTGLSFYPLREEEAKRKPLLFLDLIEESILLYDRNHFLETVLAELKTSLARLGGTRVAVDADKWYWDLKPDYIFGQEIAI